MAILGIGIDLIEISRIEKVFLRFGGRFLKRILHEKEIKEFHKLKEHHRVSFLSKRFSAKEAILKALGTGLSEGLSWKDVYIDHNNEGKPMARLEPFAMGLAKKKGIHQIHLSLSDGKEGVIAMAVAE